MLAKYTNFIAKNASGQTLTYDNAARMALRLSPWKMVGGVLTYGETITSDFGFGAGESIANAAFVNNAAALVQTGAIDNTTNVYWGYNGYFEVKHDHASEVGYFYLYAEESDDNATNMPSVKTLSTYFNPDLHMKNVATLAMDNSGDDQTFGINFWWGG